MAVELGQRGRLAAEILASTLISSYFRGNFVDEEGGMGYHDTNAGGISKPARKG